MKSDYMSPLGGNGGLNNLIPGWICRFLGVFCILILHFFTHALHAAQMPVALITDPLLDEVRLMGEEVGFTGKLTPDTLPAAGITYKWEVTVGTCVPATGNGSSDFATTLKSEGAITVKLTATYENKDYEATVTIQSIKPKVTQLSWTDSIPLRKWSIPGDNDHIVNPVWKQALTENTPSKNEAGAYVKNQQAKANLRFEGAQALSREAVVRIRGNSAQLVFPETNTTYPFQNWVADHLILSEALHNSVNQYKILDIRWAYKVLKLDGITFGDWVDVNTTMHKPLYTVDSQPATDKVYDLGLEKACGYANGDENFREKICKGVSTAGSYSNVTSHLHDLHIYDYPNSSVACCCYADVCNLLFAHVSLDPGEYREAWGGTSTRMCGYVEDLPGEVTFQCKADLKGQALENPHFAWHALVRHGEVFYDATYGKLGLPEVLEGAPAHPYGNIIQEQHPAVISLKHGTHRPPSHMTDYECPHHIK